MPKSIVRPEAEPASSRPVVRPPFHFKELVVAEMDVHGEAHRSIR